MNEEKLDKLDEFTLEMYSKLNILNSALKEDYDDLEIYAVSDFVEKIYNDLKSIRKLF